MVIPTRVRILVAVAAGLALVVLAFLVLLIAPSGEWRLLPRMARTTLTRGPSGRLNPAPIPRSGSPRIDMEPMDGLRIQAPADALDQPRQIRFTELSDTEVRAAARELGLAAAYPFMGFKLDAGMERFERFPGELTVTWDLRRAGIPEELWDHVHVVQKDEHGGVFNLDSQRDGRRLYFQAEHNSVILTYIIYTAGITIIPAGLATLYQRDTDLIPPGPYIPFRLPDADRFLIHLGAQQVPFRNPTEVARVLGEMNALRRRVDLPPIPDDVLKPPFVLVPAEHFRDPAALEKEAELLRDPDYKALVAYWRNNTWLMDNVVPTRVAHVARALVHAEQYLRSHGFRWPTYRINVYVPERQLNEFGYVADGWFTRPFVALSPHIVPGVEMNTPAWTPEVQGCWDTLNLTALHEVFHVVQSRYFWLPEVRGHDLWFWEATAVTLEDDARSYYLGQSRWNVSSWHGTFGPWSTFTREFDYTSGDQSARQQHGYGASHFLTYLRDRYYGGTPAPRRDVVISAPGQGPVFRAPTRTPPYRPRHLFLQRLMEDYSAMRGGRVRSLYRITSNSSTQLGKDYADFVRTNADTLFIWPGYPAAVLSERDPHHFWTHTEIKEMRSEVLELRLKVPADSPRELDDVVLVLRDEPEALLELGLDYDIRVWTPFSNRWADLGKDFQRGFIVPKDWESQVKAVMRTQEIERIPGCGERAVIKSDPDPAGSFRTLGLPVRLQRIEPTIMAVRSTWNRSAGKGVHAFALFKPTQAPRLTPRWEEKVLDIHIPPSPLVRKELIEGYMVTIQRWETGAAGGSPGLGGQPTQAQPAPVPPRLNFFLDLKQNQIDLTPFLDIDEAAEPEGLAGLLGPFSVGEFRQMLDVWRTYFLPPSEFRITYREVVSRKDRIIGPESEEFIVPIEAAENRFNPSGVWEGQVWLVRKPLRMEITGAAGGDIGGAFNWGDDEMQFRGVWKPEERGWELTLFTEEAGGFRMPALISLYLRPMPGNRLWLAAPPVILTNPEHEKRKAEERGEGGFLSRWLPGIFGRSEQP